MRSLFYISLFVILASFEVRADNASQTKLDLLHTPPKGTAKEWNCSADKVVKVLESSDGSTKVFPEVCVYDVKCTKRGTTESIPFLTMCKLSGSNCLDFDECMVERKKYTPTELVYSAGTILTEPKAENVTTFGDKCQQVFKKPSVLYREDPERPKKWDRICASPVTADCKMPEPLKGSFLAACKSEGVAKLSDGEFDICPPIQDCLAKPISIQPGLTISQAKALTSNATRTQAPVQTPATLVSSGSKPVHTDPNKK